MSSFGTRSDSLYGKQLRLITSSIVKEQEQGENLFSAPKNSDSKLSLRLVAASNSTKKILTALGKFSAQTVCRHAQLQQAEHSSPAQRQLE